jgi:hypothetical protein
MHLLVGGAAVRYHRRDPDTGAISPLCPDMIFGKDMSPFRPLLRGSQHFGLMTAS